MSDADVRPPAVAGQFYPEDPAELTDLVLGLLRGVPAEGRSVRGAMVPHAGLVYSGACAAQVLGRLALPATVIIIAPNHSGAGEPGQAHCGHGGRSGPRWVWCRSQNRSPTGSSQAQH